MTPLDDILAKLPTAKGAFAGFLINEAAAHADAVGDPDTGRLLRIYANETLAKGLTQPFVPAASFVKEADLALGIIPNLKGRAMPTARTHLEQFSPSESTVTSPETDIADLGPSFVASIQDDPASRFSLGGLINTVGNAVTSLIPGPVDDLLFQGAQTLLGGRGTGGSSASLPSQTTASGLAQPSGGSDLDRIAGILAGASSNPGGIAAGLGNQLGPQVASAPAGAVLTGLPSVIKPTTQQRLKAPRGYVIVKVRPDDPYYSQVVASGAAFVGQGGTAKIAMRKETARKLGYWKPRQKPVLSASQARTIRKADQLRRKVAKVAKMAGVQGCKTPRRR